MTDFPDEDVNDEIFAAVDKIVEEYNNSKQVRLRGPPIVLILEWLVGALFTVPFCFLFPFSEKLVHKIPTMALDSPLKMHFSSNNNNNNSSSSSSSSSSSKMRHDRARSRRL
jgi:hypothetical protein